MNKFSAPLAIRPATEGPNVDTAMVMAAGLGKRMRPLTATTPKPLIQVKGRALLDHVLDRLRDAGVSKAIINVHYLADAVEAHLARRDGDVGITVSDERSELLETGGGVTKALPLIDADPFFVMNSDVLWVDGPTDTLRLLAARWDPDKMDALLLLVPQAHAHCHKGRGDFHMDSLGRLTRRNRGKIAPFVYSGIQLVSKRLFVDPPAGPFSTNILWDRAIEQGRVFGLAHQGLWFDIGTPPAIKKAEALLLDG
ncbi:nucleotidyltransferase family protein [Parasphingopyxis sp. CP4]|uniref:nucleotidyltransferase family protein n=1 Tax=Parasphingopyxis sp. CP4 TaxID=2724527 RepID=UPI0015A46F9B|nr:nucleotidyltransferase family protein [Parasphingopyxis sp. CP4]QLC21571.1 nucleotidyltransferase family protein [Parasphingopyxis sp. CP4]